MTTIRFDVRDAAGIRFCVSPLWETVRSFYALADPNRHVAHLPWIREARALLTDPDVAGQLRLLTDLARPGAWLPDFLTPPPSRPVNTLDEELTVVAATRPDTVVSDLAATTLRSPLPASVTAALADPQRLVRRLTDAVRVWHGVAISPHWSRIQALLESDVGHRSRDLAEGGISRLFDRLHPTIRWHADRIVADDPWNVDLDLRGRGLPLLPSVFVDRRVLWSVRADSAPLAVYPARGPATLWQARLAVEPALAAVLGATRARLLVMLQTPATTTELARRIGVSPAAVSQHIQALHGAGLVSRGRHGRRVLYVNTEVGRALLGASTAGACHGERS